jgi:benzoyl-CoA reductase/2-hydroxyglutaryl-CoA dehydratase subunit BcrC/BadD/HgdB
MRRLGELIAPISDTPVFVMNVPSTWQSEPARGLYVDEIKRLAGFLAGLGGKTPSDPRLADVMVEFDAARSKLRQSSQLLSPRQYSRAIAAMHHGERPALAGGGRGHAPQGIPLAILGGELLDEDLAIFDSFEKAGGRIVLDATDTGERTLPCPFDPHLLPAAPLMELARAYFGTIPHAFRRPNDPLYRYLADELAARDVRGIIFRRYQWCDLWNAELPTLRDRLAMPVLDLDAGRQGDETIRLDGRIQAFMETLR